jgi:hypothetical protein
MAVIEAITAKTIPNKRIPLIPPLKSGLRLLRINGAVNMPKFMPPEKNATDIGMSLGGVILIK